MLFYPTYLYIPTKSNFIDREQHLLLSIPFIIQHSLLSNKMTALNDAILILYKPISLKRILIYELNTIFPVSVKWYDIINKSSCHYQTTYAPHTSHNPIDSLTLSFFR